MNKFQITSLLFFLLCLFASCNGIKKNKKNIDSIEIQYLKGPVETMNSIRCDSLERERDLSLSKNTLLIEKYKEIITQVRALKELKVDNTTSCDVRMQCKINCENGDSIQLCIGESNCLIKNGKAMQNNDSLVYFIRKYSGYYNYFPKVELPYFPEIKIFGIPQDYKYLLRVQDPKGRPLSPDKKWLDN